MSPDEISSARIKRLCVAVLIDPWHSSPERAAVAYVWGEGGPVALRLQLKLHRGLHHSHVAQRLITNQYVLPDNLEATLRNVPFTLHETTSKLTQLSTNILGAHVTLTQANVPSLSNTTLIDHSPFGDSYLMCSQKQLESTQSNLFLGRPCSFKSLNSDIPQRDTIRHITIPSYP
jgi:hypothetical protein